MIKAKEYLNKHATTESGQELKSTDVVHVSNFGRIEKALEIAYLEGIISITSERKNSTTNYKFKEWCESKSNRAWRKLKELMD